MSTIPAKRHATLGSRAPADHGVHIDDTPAVRVHHPANLIGAVLALLAIALLCVVSVYAHSTTLGLTQDVREARSIVKQILFIQVDVVEGLLTVLAPIAVLAELLLRRLVRQSLEAVAGAVLGTAFALGTAILINKFGVADLRSSFSAWVDGTLVVTVPPLLAGIAGLLTAAGPRGSRRTVSWSWNFLWLVLGVALITGALTLPGAIMTLLIGRATGLALRYAFGVQSERAYGSELVDGIWRTGFSPARLTRVNDDAPEHSDDETATDLAAVALTRHGDNRVYAMTTTDGERLDVVVLDGDRQVVGVLTRLWRSLRLRGIDGRTVVSLRQAAERVALLTYAARAAGVCTPRLLGIAEADDSMILIQQHPGDVTPLRDLPDEALTDDVLAAMWKQLLIAHDAGLAHRSLTADAILVGTDRPGISLGELAPPAASPPAPTVQLTGWEYGDVASSELARRMDISHLLALLALRVGAERAVDSAARGMPDDDLATVGPLLQAIALPRATREEARAKRHVLSELREALLARLPTSDIEPERLVRFGTRTVLMVTLGIVAAIVIITTLKPEEIGAAISHASPGWMAVAFGYGMLTFVGSALALVAFAPVKLPLLRVTVVQVAASFVSLMAPAGIGPAALNMRMLTKRGVSNTLAVASVGLVQVAQFITTLGLLLVLSLFSDVQMPLTMPSATVLVSIGVVALLIAAALFLPPVRQWAAAKLVPLWRTTWPRLIQLLNQPRRFVVAVAGSLIMTLSFLGAFHASLMAFGARLSLIDLALIYLGGNTLGALAPTPGGAGAVEGVLGVMLQAAIGSVATAASVVVLFRTLSFWVHVPVGWLAMKWLQRKGEL